MKGFTAFVTLVALAAAPSLASRLPLRRRDVPSSSDASVISISNFNNVIYITNITIGGVEVPVQVDTGSTDLVLVPTAPLSNTVLVSDKVNNVTEEYGTGLVSGPVLVAPFQWGSYSVEKQAFVNGTSVSAKFEENLFPTGARGVFGLGFGRVNQTVITTVFSALENDTTPAQTPVSNVFSQHPDMPNFISLLLGRADDLAASADGYLTIGEYLQGHENVGNTQRLPVQKPLSAGLRWAVYLDGLMLNGKSISLNSTVPGVPSGKSLVVLDSGAQDAQVPGWLNNLIYSSIEGAFFSESIGGWIIPCNGTVDLRFKYGDQEVFIHPLDLNSFISANDTDPTACYGSFVTNNLGADFTGFDMLLGDGFLRNVYSLFAYGNVTSAGDIIEDPYIQILPLTNAKDAMDDFHKSRQRSLSQRKPEPSLDELREQYGDNSTVSDASISGDLASDASSSDESAWSTLLDRVDHWGPVIVGLLAGNILIGILLCVVGLSMCIRRGGSSTRSVGSNYAPVKFRESTAHAEEMDATKYSD